MVEKLQTQISDSVCYPPGSFAIVEKINEIIDFLNENEGGLDMDIALLKEREPAECIPDSIKFDEGFKTGREVGFREGVESVNLAEWSKEDEDKIERLAFLVSIAAEKEMISPEECIDLRRFVKSYRPQSKQEWSEEDDEMRTEAIRVLVSGCERYHKESGCLPSWHKVIDWLKSPRTQPNKEIYKAAKHDLAIKFMNYLDENRPEGKMSLSNGECEDIDKAFKENDWTKIIRYYEKYGRRN